MKRNRLIVVILVISAVVIGVFYLIESADPFPELSDEFQDTIHQLTLEEMGLTGEQYQLLRDSLPHVDQMNAVRRRNAWMILNEMREIEFVENECPGQSNVGFATWILDIFGLGEIKEIFTVRILESVSLIEDLLILRVINTNNNTYYLLYHQSWGLWEVTKENENGEIIYSKTTHIVWDGKMHEFDPLELWIHWHPYPVICYEE